MTAVGGTAYAVLAASAWVAMSALERRAALEAAEGAGSVV